MSAQTHTLHLHDLTSLCRAFKPTASSFFVCQMWTSAASDGRALRSASTQLEAIDVRAETASGSPETAIPVKASLLLLLLLLLKLLPLPPRQQWVATRMRVNECECVCVCVPSHGVTLCLAAAKCLEHRREIKNIASFAVHYYFWYALCHSQLVP